MKNKMKKTEIKGLFFYCRPHLIVNQARAAGSGRRKNRKEDRGERQHRCQLLPMLQLKLKTTKR